jgi:hypothetical protein
MSDVTVGEQRLSERAFPFEHVVPASRLREPRWRQTLLASFAGFGVGGLLGHPWAGLIPAVVGTVNAIRSYVPRLPGEMGRRAEAGTLSERFQIERGRVIACADETLPPAARFFTAQRLRTCSQPFAIETASGAWLVVATRYLELGPSTLVPDAFAQYADYKLPLDAYVSVVFERRREVSAPSWLGAARGLGSYRDATTKVSQLYGRTTSLIVLTEEYAAA